MRLLASIVAIAIAAPGLAIAAPGDLPAPTPAPTPAPAADAQPVTSPSAATTDTQPVLAQLKDDKALADALTSITQDPSITVSDAAARPLAQALMSEGVHQLQAQHYDQALANFLEAYGKFPSPKILLNVASTLRDMGRLADAANTYQRYLADPSTGAERVAEVKDLLLRLDAQLTILTVRVFPRGADVSIDGGPFLAVGSSLQTRVRSGIHLIRLRNQHANKDVSENEVSINGFEGEQKEVPIAIQVDVPIDDPGKTATVTATPPGKPPATATPPIASDVPDHLEGWLITGTQYSAANGTGNERHVRAGNDGPEITAVMPHRTSVDHGDDGLPLPPGEEERITSGVAAQLVIDPAHTGGAGAVSLEYAANQRVDLELSFMRSTYNGGFVGGRYRLFTGWLRPYLAAGIPVFGFHDAAVFGVRGAGGLELRINGHFSVQGELGYEHFFDSAVSTMDPYYRNLFVPIVGVIGRM